ncbi:hypothetical protein [Providencia stuartii]|uniref:hypothetical protein n=1 Tax=Providencia stuartii TaxID=588 RepID=UPI0033173274
MDLHNNPHACRYCCGGSFLRVLEDAADTITAEEAIQTIALKLSLLGRMRLEYSTQKLAEQFRRLADFSPASGDPISQQEKSELCPDFSPHPTHREWSVSSGAVAPSEGTPSASAHAELQRSLTQENQG